MARTDGVLARHSLETARRVVLDLRAPEAPAAFIVDHPELATADLQNWYDHPLGASPVGYLAMPATTRPEYGGTCPGQAQQPGCSSPLARPSTASPGDRETSLITAASYGDAEIAAVLIAGGADRRRGELVVSDFDFARFGLLGDGDADNSAAHHRRRGRGSRQLIGIDRLDDRRPSDHRAPLRSGRDTLRLVQPDSFVPVGFEPPTSLQTEQFRLEQRSIASWTTATYRGLEDANCWWAGVIACRSLVALLDGAHQRASA